MNYIRKSSCHKPVTTAFLGIWGDNVASRWAMGFPSDCEWTHGFDWSWQSPIVVTWATTGGRDYMIIVRKGHKYKKLVNMSVLMILKLLAVHIWYRHASWVILIKSGQLHIHQLTPGMNMCLNWAHVFRSHLLDWHTQKHVNQRKKRYSVFYMKKTVSFL